MNKTNSTTTSRTAIVTGSAKGIGRCIAIQLAQNGFHVVINYRNEAKKDLAEEVAAACRSYGVQAACFRADVSQEADCEALVAFTKETFGSIDVLVNNAGITAYTLLTRLKEPGTGQL